MIMQQQHNTAILLFVRTELDEVRSKKWYSGAGYRNDLKLVGLLNRQVFATAKASGLPVFIISGHEQVGRNFGERFSHAFETVFNKGFDNVIALGNDCVSLRPQHLLKAAGYLETGRFVFGPAHDGGAYLIGIRKKSFDPEQFCNLPWQRSDLLSKLKEYACNQKGSFCLLSEERDADTSSELKAAIKILSFSSVVQQLLQFIGWFFKKPNLSIPHFSSTQSSIFFPQRGPPVC